MDAFLSYAGENLETANALAASLRERGFSVWFAPLSLHVGAKLLNAVEHGMSQSKAGILLITTEYLNKPWTNYEMDVLLRAHIDHGRKLLPVWKGVDKHAIEAKHAGLAGIVAITDSGDTAAVAKGLARELSRNAPTIGVIPVWESPKLRFLEGTGEIHIGTADGTTTSLWELLLHFTDDRYPLYLGGELFDKSTLLWRASENLHPRPGPPRFCARFPSRRPMLD